MKRRTGFRAPGSPQPRAASALEVPGRSSARSVTSSPIAAPAAASPGRAAAPHDRRPCRMPRLQDPGGLSGPPRRSTRWSGGRVSRRTGIAGTPMIPPSAGGGSARGRLAQDGHRQVDIGPKFHQGSARRACGRASLHDDVRPEPAPTSGPVRRGAAPRSRSPFAPCVSRGSSPVRARSAASRPARPRRPRDRPAPGTAARVFSAGDLARGVTSPAGRTVDRHIRPRPGNAPTA